MKKIRIYHGSKEIVKTPCYGQGKKYNDYGLGFYCTEDLELAKEWSVSNELNGYANEYEIDISGLSILNLSDPKYNVLHWLTILLENRIFDIKHDIAKMGKAYLIENYGLETYQYDLIKGYRADDSYFSFAQAFLNNSISVEKLARALRLGNLGEQIVLKSEEAFNRIEFAESIEADRNIYWKLRANRNEEARIQYLKTVESPISEKDLFLSDLMRGHKYDSSL